MNFETPLAQRHLARELLKIQIHIVDKWKISNNTVSRPYKTKNKTILDG